MIDENNIKSKDGVTAKEVLPLHWANYQMRQSHFWKSLNRLVLSVVTLWAIPFIKPGLFSNGIIVYFFPIVALLLSIVGRIILGAEYLRLKTVIEMFDRMTPPDYQLIFEKEKNGKKVKSIKIGKMMLGGIIVLIILSVINFIVIVLMKYNIINRPI